MLLAVDIGNTTAGFARFDGKELVDHWSEETAHFIEHGLPTKRELAHVESIRIASVVPQAVNVLESSLISRAVKAPVHVLTNRDIPLHNKYKDPLAVGIDRLLSSFAAYKLWCEAGARPTIVVDLGTATTFNCVSASGDFLGGAITLGLRSTVQALANRTAQLPEIPLHFPPHAIGTSTVEGIQSGVLYGAIAMLEGMIERMTKEAFQRTKPLLVGTGGLAEFVQQETRLFEHVDPLLVLRGIALLGKD